MATFVLVHGAWHGGWCWKEVTMRLEERGHVVHALDLPGHGEDRTPLAAISLSSYTLRIVETLEKLEDPAVLVGHSLGGLSITDAVSYQPHQIRSLVYVAGFVPQPSLDLFGIVSEGQLLQSTELDAERGIARLLLDPAEAAFYAKCSPEVVRFARERLCEEAIAPMLSEVEVAPAWHSIPRHYVECTEDRAVPFAAQRGMHQPFDFRVHTLETDHSPFFSSPDRLVDILEQAAA